MDRVPTPPTEREDGMDAADGHDLVAAVAQRLGTGLPIEVGNVTVLITAVNSDSGPSYEVWLQGACEGRHQVSLTVTAEQDFLRGKRVDLSFTELLAVEDNVVQSYLIPVRRLGPAAGRSVRLLVRASARTRNRGAVLREQRGRRYHELVPATLGKRKGRSGFQTLALLFLAPLAPLFVIGKAFSMANADEVERLYGTGDGESEHEPPAVIDVCFPKPDRVGTDDEAA